MFCHVAKRCPFGSKAGSSWGDGERISSIKHQDEHLQTVEKRAIIKARWTNPRQRLQFLMHVEPPRKLRRQLGAYGYARPTLDAVVTLALTIMTVVQIAVTRE